MSKKLGLSWPVLIGLALLAVPRAVLHDLEVLHEGTFVNLVFVVIPLLVWIAVVIAARVPRPLKTLLVVGALHGVLLAATHQVFWDVDVELGGNLAGRLPDSAEDLLGRMFAVVSSLFTGVLTGAVTGLVAELGRLISSRRSTGPGR